MGSDLEPEEETRDAVLSGFCGLGDCARSSKYCARSYERYSRGLGMWNDVAS